MKATKLGRIIKAKRTQWEMSQRQLGEESNLSAGTISRIENGVRDVPWKTINRIFFALNINVAVITWHQNGDLLIEKLNEDE